MIFGKPAHSLSVTNAEETRPRFEVLAALLEMTLSARSPANMTIFAWNDPNFLS